MNYDSLRLDATYVLLVVVTVSSRWAGGVTNGFSRPNERKLSTYAADLESGFRVLPCDLMRPPRGWASECFPGTGGGVPTQCQGLNDRVTAPISRTDRSRSSQFAILLPQVPGAYRCVRVVISTGR